jgi:type II secretory pathway component PulF
MQLSTSQQPKTQIPWTTQSLKKISAFYNALCWVVRFFFFSLLSIGTKKVDMAEQTRVKGRLALVTGASGG